MGDAFDILGIAPAFDLDPEVVRAAWLSRGAALGSLGAPPERPEATRQAAALNDARRTLDDAERRADALLTRLGGPSREEEKSLPAGLLAEMMEAREALEEARAAGDGAALERSREWATAERERRIARARALLAPLAAGAAAPAETLREARIELNAWRYVERMLEQIDEVTT